MGPYPKMYVVTRDDLSTGQQAVQLGHALTEFAIDHRELFQSWHEDSNHLIYLAVPTENALTDLLRTAIRERLKVSAFFEPDRNNELTAVAFEPRAQAFLRSLPLALRS
jgi:peptidyl-tRNA hydrolase